jgi:small subunit ribosomal protein S5
MKNEKTLEEEKTTEEVLLESVKAVEEPETLKEESERDKILNNWVPKTQLGKDVLGGKVKSIEEILGSGKKIFESEIFDFLLELKIDMLMIGQSKGKFGGGKRRNWRQTQKKTIDGNVIKFSVMAISGNEDGYVGIGIGKAKETLPAKEKAIRNAKLGLHKIARGCGSFDCSCSNLHSIPIKTEGKCSSVRVVLMPAPEGTGLVASDELKRILRLAGIKDIYSKTYGQKRSTINLAKACLDALKKLNKLK